MAKSNHFTHKFINKPSPELETILTSDEHVREAKLALALVRVLTNRNNNLGFGVKHNHPILELFLNDQNSSPMCFRNENLEDPVS